MNRRTLLRNLVLGIPIGMAMPSFLAACKKDKVFKGSVVIVGAGAAGLYAAYLFRQLGIDITILEASDRYGGRVKKLSGFSDFDIELGAEEIHGSNSEFYNIVRDSGATIVDADGGKDYLVLNNELKSETELTENQDYEKANSLVNNVQSFSQGDITAAQYIQDKGIANGFLPFCNAKLGNEYGTDNSKLGMKGVKDADEAWSAGNNNFKVTNTSFYDIISNKCSSILDSVVLNTPVKTINYKEDMVTVCTTNGKKYVADVVLVTVPIAVLQSGEIEFKPGLPSNKKSAISKIGMGPGMKIILKFNFNFWDSDLGSLIGMPLVPEFWPSAIGKSQSNNLLTAFVMGENAQYLSSLTENQATAKILEQLDLLYNGNASAGFVDARYADWTKEPYIRGAYSFPKVGCDNETRKTLAENIDFKVFFAGEATHSDGHFGTVHGAIETAIRVVDEIMSIG